MTLGWKQTLPLAALFLLLQGVTGCSTGIGATTVEGRLRPENFRFVTIVRQRGSEPGGWRAACIHVPIRRDAGDAYVCRMGIEMPIKTSVDGLVSILLAQRVAADCANQAAQIAFAPTTLETPLGLACESFKSTYNAVLRQALTGSVVTTLCQKKTEPVLLGR